jgi:hypothetical protein
VTALLCSPVVVALAVLAAHFWRGDERALAVAALASLALLAIRRRWAARAMQAILVLGAIEWLRTLAALVAMRQSMGLPYARLAAILGAVALATALCALVFERPAMRARFRLVEAPRDH